MRKLLTISLIAILLSLLLLPVIPVFGAGETVDTFYPDAGSGGGVVVDGYVAYVESDGLWWPVMRNADTGTSAWPTETFSYIGFRCDVTPQEIDKLIRSFISFDTSAIADDVVIVSASLWLRSHSTLLVDEFSYELAVNVYAGELINDNDIVIGDYDGIGVTPLSSSIEGSDWAAPSDWNEFVLSQAGVDYINKTGVTTFGLREAYKDATGVPPVWESLANFELKWFSADTAGIDYDPKLVVTYMEDSDERNTDIPGNSAEGAGEGGAITGIVWESLRCAYADEGIAFTISGAVNESIELELRSESGGVLASQNDKIRTDGYYRWSADVADSFEGFVYVIEVGSAVISDWGYVAKAPDSSQVVGNVYARYTKHPPYDYEFKDYMVGQENLQVVHWKTNLEVADMANYSFRVWFEGDSSDEKYNQTMAWLLDNYWENSYSNNDYMAHWRFILFVTDMQEGFDDKDGLILDFNESYGWDTRGMYQPLIYEDGVEEFSTTKSAYWYLLDEPLVLMLNKVRYVINEDVILNMDVGDTGLRDYWYLIKAELIDSEGGVVKTKDLSISGDAMSIVLDGWMINDNYEVRVILSGAISYDYVRDLSLVIGGGGDDDGGGFGGGDTNVKLWLEDSLDSLGLNNAPGYWIAIMVVMGVAFYGFRRSEVLRVLVPLLILGLGMVIGWIETWIIVLLALGAGVTIFMLLRKRIAGGES